MNAETIFCRFFVSTKKSGVICWRPIKLLITATQDKSRVDSRELLREIYSFLFHIAEKCVKHFHFTNSSFSRFSSSTRDIYLVDIYARAMISHKVQSTTINTFR